MEPANLLIICSDEHSRFGLGCHGGRAITPNLDKLAAAGARFANCYTPSPMCVPTRASLATGRYVHEIGTWSSAEPYTGLPEGWGHRIKRAGHPVASIGKLHFRSSDDDNGFDEEIIPMHVLGGVGWTIGLKRVEPMPVFAATKELAAEAGRGESDYTHYDRAVRREAENWLRDRAQSADGTPWVLFVSFVAPHYPLRAPDEFYDLYEGFDLGEPIAPGPSRPEDHPVLKRMAEFYDYDRHFDDESRRAARQAYFGLCSFLDDNIGGVLRALEAAGFADTTRVLYTSDHGELLGDHGLWTKMVMYENSVAVPMILSGPGIPEGVSVETPVSLIDVHPTVLEALGVDEGPETSNLAGRSLISLAEEEDPDRAVISEYHDGGAITGFFMVRWRQWKYVHYVGYQPQLFDLRADPDETCDLGTDEKYKDVRATLDSLLRGHVDPDAVNDRAFADQRKRIAELETSGAMDGLVEFNHTPLPEGV